MSPPDRDRLGLDDTFDRIRGCGVVPVVTIDRAADAVPLAEALMAGGLTCIEITFRTDAACSAIAALTSGLQGMLVAAGTVLTLDQARAACDAGARLVVSPGFDTEVVEWCLTQNIPVVPGVMTPTEITRAMRHELELVKFFPAEAAGGAATLEAVGAAFPGVSFFPTGGIGPDNLERYLRLPMVSACGGSWPASRRLIIDRDFGRVEQLAAQAAGIVSRVRG